MNVPATRPFWLALVTCLLLAAGCASVGGVGVGERDGGGVALDGGGSSDGGGASDGGSGDGGMRDGPCTTVTDCQAGQGCLSGRCRDIATYECRGDLAPIVQIEPTALDFGSVRVQSRVDKTLRIRNLGSCNLRITEVSLDPGVSPEFTCEECRPRGTYPITLVPFDSKTLTVSYTANDATPDMGGLSVVSTDPQFPLVRVPMKSSVKDAPRIFVEPAILDFGYVPVGMTKRLSFNITNSGGQTPLLIRDVGLGTPSLDFERDPISSSVDGGIAYLNSMGAPLTVNVTYRPQSLNTHENVVLVRSTDPMAPEAGVQVRLTGYSVTPPAINVNPTLINFADVVVGTRRTVPVTIENTGGGPLNLQLSFAPLSSTAFSFNPTGLPAIPGGQRATLYVDFFPTEARAQQGILNIAHNAPGTMTPVAVNLAGVGTPSTGDDVLALEMTFENGDDSFWGSDLREVDMLYSSPFFQLCGKQVPNASWGMFGQCQWVGIGPRQEPERIVHTNAGSRPAAESYKVELNYVEDCKRLPTTLISAITGIALDVVLAYFAGGLVPSGTGSTIANAILSNCFDRDSTRAQVKAYVNGTLSTSRTVTLSRRGDLATVFTITRENGRFTIR